MEKEGLQRVLNFIEDHHLDVQVLVTDRHKQINKWLRENHPNITHYFDVWHIAKGIYNYNNSYIYIKALFTKFKICVLNR